MPTSDSSNIPDAIQLLNAKIALLQEQSFQTLRRKALESMTVAELLEFSEERERIVALSERSAALEEYEAVQVPHSQKGRKLLMFQPRNAQRV